MFVDASAIVAILTREPEADTLADVLQSASSPVTSPIAVFEAVLGICRKRLLSVEQAEEHGNSLRWPILSYSSYRKGGGNSASSFRAIRQGAWSSSAAQSR
jgi:uncharacterized protein with PIN domain